MRKPGSLRGSSAVSPQSHDPASSLTLRQRMVLRLYARTGSLKVVAGDLEISEKAARQHAHHAYMKLGVTDGISAFRALGWLQVPG